MSIFLRSQNKIVRFCQFVMFVIILFSVFPRMFLGNEINLNRLTYYTVQTNLVMAVYWFLASSGPARYSSKKFEIFRLMATTAIIVTGSLYFIFLHAGYMSSLKEQLQKGGTTAFIYGLDMFDTWVNHFTVPILALTDFIMIRPHVKLVKPHIFFALAIPFAYFVYHSLNGLITGEYLYSFIDPIKLRGWIPLFEMFVVLAAFILIISFVLFAVTQKKVRQESDI